MDKFPFPPRGGRGESLEASLAGIKINESTAVWCSIPPFEWRFDPRNSVVSPTEIQQRAVQISRLARDFKAENVDRPSIGIEVNALSGWLFRFLGLLVIKRERKIRFDGPRV